MPRHLRRTRARTAGARRTLAAPRRAVRARAQRRLAASRRACAAAAASCAPARRPRGTGEDVVLVPVSVFWGRAPDREGSLCAPARLRALDRDERPPPRPRRALRPHASVRALRPSLRLAGDRRRRCRGAAARGAARRLRTQFRKAREALRPRRSHRRTLVNRVVAPAASAAQRQSMRRAEGIAASKALAARAPTHAQEIASDLSFGAIRFFDVLLTWLWTKPLRRHRRPRRRGRQGDRRRSHAGLRAEPPQPHGLPVAELRALLQRPHAAARRRRQEPEHPRRGAAAAPRRRLLHATQLPRRSALPAVFEEYLDRVFASGSSVEYFVEGGRSRTGACCRRAAACSA